MILTALNAYYDRLADDPDADIAPLGFSRQKISFCVVLEKDGRLHAFQQVGHAENGRNIPKQLTVPGQAKPSGQGINPCFLWDNAAYMLGYKADDPKPERTRACFEAFRKRHLDAEAEVGDPAFSAVCRFLESWDPAKANEHPELAEVAGSFGVFQLRAVPGYVHELPAVLEYWSRHGEKKDGSSDEEMTATCLVTGRRAPIARLHEPKIKGVIGGQTAGTLLVSFNEDAYTSYGKSQSFNAPVSVEAAFKYATALNRLLADDTHRVRLGDATVAFWSDRPTPFESIFGYAVGEGAEDPAVNARVKAFFDALRQGRRAPDELGDPSVPFYILGLSPNASRLSVRFWLVGTVGEFAERLARHVNDLEMIGERPDNPPLVIRQLLFETAREAKDIPPQLAGEVARAVFTGGRYPQVLFAAIIRRIQADRRVNHPRAAALKAFLIRNRNREVPVSLDPARTDPAYRLGRLFAALEKTQEDALPGLNATIKDRYFGAASATPASVFPRLLRLHHHHLGKIESTGQRVNREKLVQSICDGLDAFPLHLPLDEQGLFHIGYYHQRQAFFQKKAEATAEEITV